MIVRELVAMLSVKSDKAGMNQANKGMTGLIGVAKQAAAAFAAFKLVKWVKSATEEVAALGDEFDKMSKKTGVSTQALQEWGFVAELAGSSLGGVERVIKRLQYSVDQADQGVAMAKDGFKRLKINVKDSNGELKTATQLLPELADTLGQMENSSEQAALAQQLLGKSAIDLLPLLQQGSEAIAEQAQELHDLGAVMDEDLIMLSAEYTDNLTRLNRMFLGIKFTIAQELLPVFIEMQESTIDWWKANKLLVAQHIGPIFKGIGTTIGGVARFFGDVASKVLKFITNLTGTEKAILGISTAIILIGRLLKAGPIGKFLLLIALIALLIEDFQVWREGGESAIGAIIEALEEWLDIDIEQWFIDMEQGWAIIAPAAKDAMSLIATTFFALMDLLGSWEDEFDNSAKKSTSAWDKFLFQMVAAFDEKGINIKEKWKSVVDFFKSYFSNFGGWWVPYFKGLVDSITGYLDTLDKKFLGGAAGKIAGLVGNLFAPPKFTATRKRLPGSTVAEQSKGQLPVTDIIGMQKAIGFNPLVAGASSLQSNPTLHDNKTINLKVINAEGMNKETLGAEIDKRITESTDRANRQTLNALLPVKAG